MKNKFTRTVASCAVLFAMAGVIPAAAQSADKHAGIDVSGKSPIRFNTDVVSQADMDRINNDHEQEMIARNPNYNHDRAVYEQQIQNFLAQHPNGKSASTQSMPVITVPVVVHVVYNTAAQNISDNQVFSQIQVLNEDFGRTNADAANTPAGFTGVAANTNIQFCLAQRNPSGQSTNGIDRRQISTNVSFSTNDNVKHYSSNGLDAWDPTQYLNIWVCNLGSGLLGYGEFPTGTVSQTMGVVILYSAFGSNFTSYGTFSNVTSPYDRGRTTTHEFSHCLNLYHIWGDDGTACSGSDLCADTPNQAGATTTCFTYPHTDACSTSSPGIQFMNYMDYSYDNCLNMFSANQAARMNAVLSTAPYNALTTSNGCLPVNLLTNDGGISAVLAPSGTVCATTVTPSVTLKNFGAATLTSCTINYKIDNNTVQTYSWTGSVASLATTNVTLPSMTTTAGSHTFTAYTSSPNGQTDGQPSNDQSTSTFTVSATGTGLPYVEGFESTTFPTNGITLNNPDGSTTWARTTAAAKTGVASAFMDDFNYNAAGQVDEMILPNFNLSSTSNPAMTFQVAYQLYTNPTANPSFSDTLRVLISTDCGATWTTLYNKFGTTLTTTTPTYSTTSFVPTASQWRLETISLTPYASSSNAIIKFRHICDYENQMYLDDINIQTSTGINDQDLGNLVNLYPNPTSGELNVSIVLPQSNDVKVRVLNTLGQVVSSTEQHNTFGGIYNMNLSGQPSGVYFVEVTTGKETITKRVLLSGK